MKKDEAAKVLEALNLAAEVLDELPTWSNTGHAANTAHEAIDIMRREVEQPRWTPEELAAAEKRANECADWFVRGTAPQAPAEQTRNVTPIEAKILHGALLRAGKVVKAEPISDAEILALWPIAPLGPTSKRELIKFARALLEAKPKEIIDAECKAWKQRNYALIDEAVILKVRIDELLEANSALVSALDRIRDVLRGAYVDDVALIVNNALDKNRKTE